MVLQGLFFGLTLIALLANNISWGGHGRGHTAAPAPAPPPVPSHPAGAPGGFGGSMPPDYGWMATPHRMRIAHVMDEGTDTDTSPPVGGMHAIAYTPSSRRRSPTRRELTQSPSRRARSPQKFY